VGLRRKRGKQEAKADRRASKKPIVHDGILPKGFLLLSRRIFRGRARVREAALQQTAQLQIMLIVRLQIKYKAPAVAEPKHKIAKTTPCKEGNLLRRL
jgi:hypothetical protein